MSDPRLAHIDPAMHDRILAIGYDLDDSAVVAVLESAHPVPIPPVDLSELVAVDASWREAEGLRARRAELVRAAYREGATASELAEALGVTVSRVNQLVAGARRA